MRISFKEKSDLEDSGVHIEPCIFYFMAIDSASLLQHLFNSFCIIIFSLLRFFFYSSLSNLCCMQTERTSNIEVLLAFGPLLDPFLCNIWSSIYSKRFSESLFEVLAILFRRLDMRQSCVLKYGRGSLICFVGFS